MKFVIRDDDLNFFTKPVLIEEWYGDLFKRNIPVGFSAIPFVKPKSDVYTGGEFYEDREYPISQNIELVKYVKSNKMIEILQHGCTHDTKSGIYEYAKKDDLFFDTKRGKEELARAFGVPPKVFVPPHDWIGVSGIKAIENNQMNIIRGRGAGLRNFIIRKKYFYNFIKMAVFRFPKYISTKPPVYPNVLNFGKHKEMCSYRLEDPDIFEGLEEVYKKKGSFVVVNHIHTMNQEKKDKLISLVEKAKSFGAEFIYPSDLFI